MVALTVNILLLILGLPVESTQNRYCFAACLVIVAESCWIIITRTVVSGVILICVWGDWESVSEIGY